MYLTRTWAFTIHKHKLKLLGRWPEPKSAVKSRAKHSVLSTEMTNDMTSMNTADKLVTTTDTNNTSFQMTDNPQITDYLDNIPTISGESRRGAAVAAPVTGAGGQDTGAVVVPGVLASAACSDHQNSAYLSASPTSTLPPCT